MLPPRPLLASAILLVGGLAWSIADSPPPAASLAEAIEWEGQAVTLTGWATDVQQTADGARFTLVDGGDAVAVRVGAPLALQLHAGDAVEAAGRLGRWQGQLRLDVEDADDVRLKQQHGVAPTVALSWDDLTTDPDAWAGRPVLLRGTVSDGRLVDGKSSIALGEGAWPRDGRVQAQGLVRWDGDCLCHRLDAREVWPWTP
jgi:hypothetical protein